MQLQMRCGCQRYSSVFDNEFAVEPTNSISAEWNAGATEGVRNDRLRDR
jgi:hypothetical protein